MLVTKFPQSCLILEKDGQRIVIDPGNMVADKYSVTDLGNLEAVLYTHKHPDHFDQGLADQLSASSVKFYGNAAVVELFGDGITKVESGQDFEVAGFSIMPRDLPHCVMANGDAGPQNTGFVIDGTFFHPGDGIELAGMSVPDLALPIAGPSISLRDAVAFATQLEAKRVIPVHYSNHDFFPGNPDGLAKIAKSASLGFEVIVLKDGESIEF